MGKHAKPSFGRGRLATAKPSMSFGSTSSQWSARAGTPWRALFGDLVARLWHNSAPVGVGAMGALGAGGLISHWANNGLSGAGYGKTQMEADSRTMAGSADSILKTLGIAGLVTGVGTGVSHILRSRESEAEDNDLLQADVNEMGVRPQKKKYKKIAGFFPPELFLDKNLHAAAPESSGEVKYPSAYSPWWALPGLAAAGVGGYLGGKSLADLIGYGLRRRPVKKRLEKAKKEFEETVAGYSKGASLERRLSDGFVRYKQGSAPVGLLATGMGGLGVLSALAAYHRFKNPTSMDVYRKQLSRYLVGGVRRPIVRVRPSTELALEREADELEEKTANTAARGGAGAGGRPFALRGTPRRQLTPTAC